MNPLLYWWVIPLVYTLLALFLSVSVFKTFFKPGWNFELLVVLGFTGITVIAAWILNYQLFSASA